MISLDSPAQAKLHHTYGSASGIPVLLKQLEHHPKSGGNAEPWDCGIPAGCPIHDGSIVMSGMVQTIAVSPGRK